MGQQMDHTAYITLFRQLLQGEQSIDSSRLDALADTYPYALPLWVLKAGQEEHDPEKRAAARNRAALSASSAELATNFFIIPQTSPSTTDNTGEKATGNISRYHDDLLPYSFRWWLHKTRLEHAGTYQPYAPTKQPNVPGQMTPEEELLNQQIRENIFHLQDPEEKLSRKRAEKTVTFRVNHKENPAIERFIREEPQISPPRPDAITLENKARKSSEDRAAFVSETLAKIYTEQGLYDKALDTYQKLSLKYPEKSAYFADLIAELKEKLN
jgi:hypothetical protein